MRRVGLRIYPTQPDDRRAIFALAYSGSKRWRMMLRQRDQSVGVRRAIVSLFKLAFRHVGEHLRLPLCTAWSRRSSPKATA
ncbi:hypothetical protein GWK36_01615 [Caldichromatium japonicum]|uniref:Transposase n=1 Tax=Caldichromatium japonicum TaxID=2699430 RepID=A0A6G7VA21_9GAMM|nr:hypothetical protein [Caldichromatium japonicum]QIK36909.1 hypothetical protein GWK36_01615 [Caldichromatium japonicum]